MSLIRRKAKGEQIQAPEPEEREAPDDLAAALEASLARRRVRGAQHGRRRRAKARR